jgi:toxin YoeB
MNLLWSGEGWEDYLYWQETDRGVVRRINALIADIRRGRYEGIGKPEPLRDNLSGWWSRRITGEHRLVYRIIGTGDAQRIEIMMCRFHYGRRS